MKVAITGATGFLGSHLVEQLRDRFDVVGVVRTPEKGEHLQVPLAKADLTDLDALTSALQGCDVLVANAALAPGWKKPTPEQYIAANVEGAQNQLEAARRAGVTRVVWISTVAVYRTRLFRRLDESAERIDPGAPRFDWNNLTTDPGYTRSKAAAEALAWRFAEKHGLALTAVRPGPVYGPRDLKMTARYARMLTWRIAPAPTVRLPHVHAADVALAVGGAIESSISFGRSYNLAGEDISPAAFLRIWRDAQGSSTRILPIPIPLSIRFDDSAARRDLGFRSRSIAEAVQQMPLG